jgi:hypothetical protein
VVDVAPGAGFLLKAEVCSCLARCKLPTAFGHRDWTVPDSVSTWVLVYSGAMAGLLKKCVEVLGKCLTDQYCLCHVWVNADFIDQLNKVSLTLVAAGLIRIFNFEVLQPYSSHATFKSRSPDVLIQALLG